eukprot:2091494-Rhodomonas_salina.4
MLLPVFSGAYGRRRLFHLPWYVPPTCLRPCYAMSGTPVAYDAMGHLEALPSTPAANDAMVPAYVPATPCPVLSGPQHTRDAVCVDLGGPELSAPGMLLWLIAQRGTECC